MGASLPRSRDATAARATGATLASPAVAFLPAGFTLPEPLATERFRLRKLSVEDVVRDYAAVMSSRERLWELFGEGWGWPPAEMTLLEDLVDLGWHQKEFER